MQIIQSPLGSNIHPLGVISSLSTPDRMILRKQSHSLHSRSNFLSPIQTKLPLVTSSKFFLSREHEPSIQPLIGWDSWDNQDINSDLPLLESDSSDSIALPENSHVNTSEIVKDSIPELLPNRINKKTSDDSSQQLNIKSKSKSKKINKSQKPLEKKSKSKSKKAVKSSVAKNIVQSNVTINGQEDSLLALDESLSVEANLEIPTLQLDNAVVDNSLVLPSALTSPDLDDAPTLIHPLANDENTVRAHIAVPNSESSVTKSPITLQQEIDSNISSESPASIPVQLTPTSADIEDAPSLFRNSDNNEALVISESQSAMVVNLSDISANLTSLQGDSYVESTNSEFTESQPILVPPEIVETPIITPTSSEIGETAIAPLFATSPEISETPIITPTSPEIGETAIAPLLTTSSEIVETPTITTTSPEIGETAIAPLTTTSPEIGETPIITTTSPEIGETPIITTTSPEIGETVIAPLLATSPEIGETVIAPLTAKSPEIVETPTITPTLPENFETAIAPLSATSPEIGETPTITATSPEIGETGSIFRKIIDNEPTVESEFTSAVTNPEIPTFVDTLDNPTSPQNEVNTLPQVKQNAIAENLPAPKGYATGGHVIDSHVENRQQIAPSDTVPAMLTPGEFVINTRDAQKNLPLLHHINTGGTPHDIILPSLQTPNAQEPEEITSPETPTKVDSFPDTSLQLKSTETHSLHVSNSLIPSSLGLDIGKQNLSILNSPQLNPLQNETIHVDEASPQYSSPPLIFRKANSSNNTSSQWSNTPSQWSSVEDLLNGNNDELTSFNFNDVESNSQNYEFSQVSESPQVFAKHLPSLRGFADGGEVIPSDISREIAPVTETIESASSFSQEDDKDDTSDLEALAREIYNRLRQRIEIERERHGGYSGRLPW